MNPEIDVYIDRVVFEKQILLRPPHISPSKWMAYWERVKHLMVME